MNAKHAASEGDEVIQSRSGLQRFRSHSTHYKKTKSAPLHQTSMQNKTLKAKYDVILSYLASARNTIRNQMGEKQRVGRSKEETWLVLEQLEYSWGRVTSTERDWNRLFLGLPPLSPPSHTIMHHPHPSLSPVIHLSLPQQGPVAQFPSRPLNSWFHVLHWRMGDVRWVGISEWAITAEDRGRKWLHWLLSLDFSCVWSCCG